MKKLIAFGLVAVVVLAGYFYVSGLRLQLPGAAGKLDKVTRGDLVIPINATGEVRPNARLEVKSEASGEVVEIVKNAGEWVLTGDLLIRLAKDDEERSVQRAESDLKRAEAALDSSKIAVEDRKARVTTATADRDRIQQQLEQAQFDLELTRNRIKQEATNPQEVKRAETTAASLEAQLRGANAGIELAKFAVLQAEKDVITAEQAHSNAKVNLADARERLSETEIRSKIDGVLSQVNVEVGDVIQSGKAVVGGGTILAVIADMSKLIVRTEIQEVEVGEIIKLAPQSARPQMTPELAVTPGTASSEVEPAIAGGASVVAVGVDAFPDEKFEGVIERIYPEPKNIRDIVTYLVDVRVTSENREMLMLGMRARVDFKVQSLFNVLLVRNEAVHEDSEGRKGVYIPGERSSEDKNEIPKPVFLPCEFGITDSEHIHVVSSDGLKEGQAVYTVMPQVQEPDDEEHD